MKKPKTTWPMVDADHFKCHKCKLPTHIRKAWNAGKGLGKQFHFECLPVSRLRELGIAK